ncbi:unnamed protein product [Danaus chrysippus]|uniref:(African queen) hypothetical protein n=1 Tax=Danaus chrysippus TaxID=151541 RepID=A0A8J2W8X0_9NEOP|nr:unnamed protein product [Danaus chrysippus]
MKVVDCAKIKCPAIDDPVCVKIKYKNSKNYEYVIAVNKCEIKYATCQKDVEAVMVPMVKCHNSSDEIKCETNEDFTGEGTKLNADSDKSRDIENDDVDNETVLMANETNDGFDKNGESDINYEEGGGKNGQWIAVVDTKVLNDKQTEENEVELDGEDNTNEAGNKEDDLKKPVTKELKDYDSNDDPEAKDDNEDNNDEDDYRNKEYGEENLVTVGNFGKDYDQQEEEADLEESRKDCPTVCPSRDVMVCAKCKHQIHRTFLSACHLRMFACQHPNEKLELVKRKPCMQSGPFLSKFEDTRGRIHESREDDEIQKFIFCRENNLINKSKV